MSLISVIYFILITISYSSAESEEEENIKPIRICKENKDYVDAAVMFRNSFWVIIDRMYYEFNWIYDPFVYKAEGIQEIFLREYDKTWPKPGDEKVKTGRLLAGFYHHEFLLELQMIDENEEKVYDFGGIDIDKHPFWNPNGGFEIMDQLKQNITPPHNDNILNVNDYFHLMYQKQIVIFKDEHNSKDKYHIKQRSRTEDQLREFVGTELSFNKLQARGGINSLFEGIKGNIPPRIESLPLAFDFVKLLLYVIINQKDENDVPRLYYNSFKYKNFDKNWKSIDIPKNYRYNAFIPSRNLPFYDSYIPKERTFEFIFHVIGEPFRDTKEDKERGPSFTFLLKFKNTTQGLGWASNQEPIGLEKLPKSGMSLFGCQFINRSSYILYTVFGVIIAILVIILIVVIGFVGANYCFGKTPIIIVRQNDSDSTQSTSNKRFGTFDNSRMRHKTTDTASEGDKRSDLSSSHQDTLTSDHKIKI